MSIVHSYLYPETPFNHFLQRLEIKLYLYDFKKRIQDEKIIL